MLVLYTYCVYTFNLKWIERLAAISQWHAIQIKFCDHLWLLVSRCNNWLLSWGYFRIWECSLVARFLLWRGLNQSWHVNCPPKGGRGGGVGCHKEVAINEASTVSIYSRRYKCNPPMALFSRFNYKVELKLQKDHTSREFEAKFTDKIMQHLKDEGPRTIYKPASHAIHKPCQDKN